MDKKYELTDIAHPHISGLYRIRALRGVDDGWVKPGDYGGYVASEKNLPHDDESWVYGDALVSQNATLQNSSVRRGAMVGGNAKIVNSFITGQGTVVTNNARIEDSDISEGPMITGNTKIKSAEVEGRSLFSGDIQVLGTPRPPRPAGVPYDPATLAPRLTIKGTGSYRNGVLKDQILINGSPLVDGKGVRIGGTTQITDSPVFLDNAKVEGSAWIKDNVFMNKDSKVSGRPLLAGHAVITDEASVGDQAIIADVVLADTITAKGRTTLKNPAVIKDGLITKYYEEKPGRYPDSIVHPNKFPNYEGGIKNTDLSYKSEAVSSRGIGKNNWLNKDKKPFTEVVIDKDWLRVMRETKHNSPNYYESLPEFEKKAMYPGVALSTDRDRLLAEGSRIPEGITWITPKAPPKNDYQPPNAFSPNVQNQMSR